MPHGTGGNPGSGSGSAPPAQPRKAGTAQILLPQIPLLQPPGPQGAGLGIKDAQGTELGDAWHLPAPCPPSGQSVVPKSPVTLRHGTHRPGRLENPSFAIGTAARMAEGGHRARVSSTQPHRCFGKVKGCGGPAAGHPGTAGTAAWELMDPLPSQAGSAVPLNCVCPHWNFPSLQ